MGIARDSLRLGAEYLFDVIAIGLNYEGKLAMRFASDSCTSMSDPFQVKLSPHGLSHARPSFSISTSASGGPHVPAG